MTQSKSATTIAILALLAGLPLLPVRVESADLPQYERTRILEDGGQITDVSLTNQAGEEFSLSDLRRRVVFIFLVLRIVLASAR